MGVICAIVEKKGDARAPQALVDRMLAAAVAGRAPAGAASSSASAANGQAAAGFADFLGGQAARGVHEDDSLLAVCDGEFYNAAELRSLAGLGPDAGEAALFAALWKKHGEAWWKPVRGTFGAFVWDKAARKAHAYTDRIGVRPIVWHEDAERIAVATRLASFSALPGARSPLDHQGIFSYLFMEMIPTPFTLYKQARKLESGHALAVEGGNLKVSRYWNMAYPEGKKTDQSEVEESIRRLMRQAVGRQAGLGVSSAEDLGAFLSGGTDSSLVAGLVSELHPGKAKTFSIGFDESGYDEMGFARIAVDRFKTRSHEYYVSHDDIVNALPAIVRAFDEPFANSSVIPTYFCALKARETGVKVMLGGDGGDEIFGGNSRYLDNYKNFSRFPKPVEWAMAAAVAMTPSFARKGPVRKAANYLSRKTAPLHQRIHAYDLSYYLGDVSSIFSKDFLGNGGPFQRPQDVAERVLSNAEAGNELDRYLYHDLKITLMDNDLRKVNTMTELAGVQVRYPFLDTDMVEFTGLIPPDMKVRPGMLRYVYKEAFKDILPQDIINKKKHGFGLPVVRWMLRPGRLKEMLEDALLDGRLKSRRIFKDGFVEDLYKRAQTDKTTYFGSYLYYIFFLELWMREHVDGNSAREAAPRGVSAVSAGRA